MLYIGQLFESGERPQTAPRFPWAVDHWTRLGRFLILGSESGTYYIGDREQSLENAAAVRECLQEDGLRVVRTIAEASTSGRAPKNDPALFALALAASPQFASPETNAAALDALAEVARTGTDLCTFAAFVTSLRGWGRGLRSAIAQWYLKKPLSELADQLIKFKPRGTWSHRDLLRLSHPKAETPASNALFQWAVEGGLGHWASPEVLTAELRQIQAFELAKKAASESEVVHLIEDYRLTHEMIPSEWKNSARVWEALLDSMPYAALVGNLARLTAVGLLAPQSPATALAVARLIDRKRVAQSRVHPIALLAALLAYRQGRGDSGSLEWTPVASVIDALDRAFHLAFDNLEPTGKRICLALDAGASMQHSVCAGMPNVPVATASAALAMVFARTELHCTIAAFHDQIWHAGITRQHRLDRACEAIVCEPRGTDASLPMRDALERGLAVDAFVIVTGNPAWSRDRDPVQALERYRRQTGIAAKLVVIAMAANQCSIADPNDAFQMDVAGFDASVPQVVSNFIRSRLP
ncbi:MAG: TROVE domain-containing protein [Acidobacteriia bacterium]|nr:TROVE domain-containing protein [Terriglobia bacterium]